jgi:hypothetical protein
MPATEIITIINNSGKVISTVGDPPAATFGNLRPFQLAARH